MKKYSTWTVPLLATISLLAAAVSLGASFAPGEAAVVAGSQEIRWYENGPYQGNPDNPGIDRPQVLEPTTDGVEATIESPPLIVIVFGSVTFTIDFPTRFLDFLEWDIGRPKR